MSAAAPSILIAVVLLLLTLFTPPSTLHAQPAVTSRVLDLDGRDSYVELSANLFTNEVVTVEGWVKWRAFGDYSRFFEFGDAALMVGVFNFGRASELTIQRVGNRAYDGQTMDKAPADYLSADQWRHVVMVAGTSFVKLYVNGALVATENSKSNWKPAPVPVLKNFLGRSVVKEAGNNPDFNGQMAEIRLWGGNAPWMRSETISPIGSPAANRACWRFGISRMAPPGTPHPTAAMAFWAAPPESRKARFPLRPSWLLGRGWSGGLPMRTAIRLKE